MKQIIINCQQKKIYRKDLNAILPIYLSYFFPITITSHLKSSFFQVLFLGENNINYFCLGLITFTILL